MVAAFIADLQPVAIVQRPCQTHACHAAGHSLDRADGQAAVVDAFGENDPRVLAAQSIAIHQAAAGKDLLEVVHFRHVRLAEGAAFHRVDALAVAGCDGRHVFRALQTAFQLDRARTRLHQLRQMVAHAHIAGAEPGRCFSAIGIGQTARLGTPAAVAAAAADHGGKQALSADRDALGAMTEDLDLDAHVGCLADFRQGAFPGQHRAGQAMPLDKAYACGIVQRHLSGGMDGQIREAGTGQMHHAQVLHKHRIHTHFIQQPQHFQHTGKLAVLDQRIDRHMHMHVMQVREMHGLPKLCFIEVTCSGTGRKCSIS